MGISRQFKFQVNYLRSIHPLNTLMKTDYHLRWCSYPHVPPPKLIEANNGFSGTVDAFSKPSLSKWIKAVFCFMAAILMAFPAAPVKAERVTEGLVVLYTFIEGTGATAHDVSGVGATLDLGIGDVGKTNWIECGGLSVNDSTLISSSAASQ